jgi:DNA helicase-2/ATP-dependent DNA helicase PcrA
MPWNDGLLPDQQVAASHIGTHARMLAGPGTGKTLVLTRRIIYLIHEQHVNSNGILALTFTRAAANELRQRVATELTNQPIPRISTLHSFALRQLLRNSRRLTVLPQPLRIADDWEERYIVLEDLKATLHLRRISDANELFNQLSSDWESLAIDEGIMTPDPRFIGAWEEHRRVYGYTLRSELVYQLKRSLEQLGDFELESPILHLLVDEYQDLNRCDLAVISAIARRGVELFVAGDDDQSIYGFRRAHPEGIRHFSVDYASANDLPLHVCKRCDPEILRLADFVADLDTQRIKKDTRAEHDRPRGEVNLLRFSDERAEADGVAQLCSNLFQHEHMSPDDILILLRVDTKRAFSRELERAFAALNIPLAVDPGSHSPLDETTGRQVLAFLRIVNDPQDHLAWTTLIRLRRNGIGQGCLNALYQLTRDRGEKCFQTLQAVTANPGALLSRFGVLVAQEVNAINQIRNEIATIADVAVANQLPLTNLLQQVVGRLVSEEQARQLIVKHLAQIAATSVAKTIAELLVSIQAASMDIEPELESGKVNVLTMHKAKGLTAGAVIILAAEDEHIPGRQDQEPQLGDERRLLFVSLTRAKHMLFITYCDRRLGQQRMLGRHPGRQQRTLTQFLRHTPLRPVLGVDYLATRWQPVRQEPLGS